MESDAFPSLLFYLSYVSTISLNSLCSLHSLFHSVFSWIIHQCHHVDLFPCQCCVCVCVYISAAVVWVHLCVSVSGPSNALLIQSSAVICVTDLSLMGEQLRTILCHRGGVAVCNIFAVPLHVFVWLHLEMWPREPAMVCVLASVCVCVCTCEHEQQCSSFPSFSASAQCHSEEPGGDSRGRGSEVLTAATCHISQLKFGGNQFRTLIRSMTPTPAAAEEPRPMVAPPPLQKMRNWIPRDTSHQS